MKDAEAEERAELDDFFRYLKDIKQPDSTEPRAINIITRLPEQFNRSRYRLSENEIGPETQGYSEL